MNSVESWNKTLNNVIKLTSIYDSFLEVHNIPLSRDKNAYNLTVDKDKGYKFYLTSFGLYNQSSISESVFHNPQVNSK